MKDPVNKVSNFKFGTGTTQYQRLHPALLPENAPIHGMSLSELMAYSVAYSQNLVYYDEKNQADGYWSDFLLSDISFILSTIISLNLEKLDLEFNELVSRFYRANQKAQRLEATEAIFEFIKGMALRLNTWRQQVNAISLPNSDIEYQVSFELESIIQSQAGEDLRKLIAYDLGAGAKGGLGAAVGLSYKEFGDIWEAEGVAPVNIFLGDRMEEQFNRAMAHIRLVYRSFLNTLTYAKFNFEPYFQQALLHKSDHKPHAALLMAFLSTLGKAQGDLNHVSDRYLKFYYENYLQLFPATSVPDTAHICFDLADHVDSMLLRKGTKLQSEGTNNVVFETNQDLELNQAEIASLRTMYLSKFSKIETSNFQLVTGIYAAPVANSKDGSGLPFEEPNEPWPTFGEEQAEKPANDRSMEKASLGFAFSSPVFYLKEGLRKVRMKIHFQKESAGILKKLVLDVMQKANTRTDKIETLTLEEAFYKRVFNQVGNDRNIRIHYSNEKGWIRIDSNLIRIFAAGEGGWPKAEQLEKGHTLDILETLGIEFTIQANQPAASPFGENHPEAAAYNSAFPIVKVLFDDSVEPYPYSFLREVIIQNCEIEVEAERVKGMQVYNSLGRLDNRQPFQAFGPQPKVGEYMLIGNEEIFRKHIQSLSFEVDWLNLPKDSEDFRRYYQQYNKDLSPEKYKVGFKAYANGDFYPIDNDSVLTFPLFPNAGTGGKELAASKFTMGIEQLQALQLAADPFLQEPNEFNPDTQTGYLRMEILEPDDAFGHQLYTKVFTQTITHNAQAAEEDKLSLPNEPFSPQVKNIYLHYKANTQFTPASVKGSKTEKIYHVHPFGVVDLTRESSFSEGHLTPELKEDGYLFLGIQKVKPMQTLSLLFQLVTRSAQTASAFSLPKTRWSYLSHDTWVDFTERQVVYDSTDQFTKTGIVRLHMPRAVFTENSLLPPGYFWIRVGIKGSVDLLCHCIAVKPQAVAARSLIADPGERLRVPLPPITITRLVEPNTYIKGIEQPFESFGGKAMENYYEFFSRVSERLRHKARAVTHWDLERLILDRFHEVLQVKCLSHLNCSTHFQPGDGVTLVIVPKRNQYLKDNTPKVNYRFLNEVEDFITARSSPFLKAKARNPLYEYIRVICNVKFDVNSGLMIQELTADLRKFIAPWLYDSTASLPIGSKMDENTILNFIKSLPYVRFVTKFSILHLVEKEDHTYEIHDTATEKGVISILEPRPWGVLMPDTDHQINLIEFEEEEPPMEVKPPIRFQNKIDISKDSKFINIRPRAKEAAEDEGRKKLPKQKITIRL